MSEPWPLDSNPADYDLLDVRAVLGDRVLENARVIVRDGRIAAVEPMSAAFAAVGRVPGTTRVPRLRGHGLFVAPGLIDTHSDALEREKRPRPTAELPWEFAIVSLEGRAVGAGVTTMFHGAGFQNKESHKVTRTPGRALELAGVVDAAPAQRIDHRVLHRLDILSDEGAAALGRRLESLADASPAPLVSFEDHTPGQGQYTDPEPLKSYWVGMEAVSAEEADARIAQLMERAEKFAPTAEANTAWLGGLATDGRIRLLGHDPDSAEMIAHLVSLHCVAAEFPVNLEAARAARAAGLLIVGGAPNLLRGGSHTNNVAAADLLREGLLDVLSSDYLPSALLAAAFRAADDQITDLPHAIGLVTSGPARLAGLDDRGRLAEGLRADLVVVDASGRYPRVATTLTAQR
ncbi:alpha-D-ribose 1-methylphosphonate 5-triphosphate diphosphatase [Brooklawnia cerclae]|uniref:Alpha-D-ribose 1-methylphosphonate 5-triphosphate diphosphatase n=1 Tax=Brooklawnia cerclae TaxID=349934 RepID=A0ABX0SML3_9ACTN|nr:alpha-D-ribose 1-methylphosphonate 5-triphosphate diphosphatase [Brooklawnia cerclae]NIH58001.1 alpha-D-ribose 1-methylphosphonate 5-triphosphate diphosphatase [Brooklawnia cerclae]